MGGSFSLWLPSSTDIWPESSRARHCVSIGALNGKCQQVPCRWFTFFLCNTPTNAPTSVPTKNHQFVLLQRHLRSLQQHYLPVLRANRLWHQLQVQQSLMNNTVWIYECSRWIVVFIIGFQGNLSTINYRILDSMTSELLRNYIEMTVVTCGCSLVMITCLPFIVAMRYRIVVIIMREMMMECRLNIVWM